MVNYTSNLDVAKFKLSQTAARLVKREDNFEPTFSIKKKKKKKKKDKHKAKNIKLMVDKKYKKPKQKRKKLFFSRTKQLQKLGTRAMKKPFKLKKKRKPKKVMTEKAIQKEIGTEIVIPEAPILGEYFGGVLDLKNLDINNKQDVIKFFDNLPLSHYRLINHSLKRHRNENLGGGFSKYHDKWDTILMLNKDEYKYAPHQAYNDLLRVKHPYQISKGLRAEEEDIKNNVIRGAGFWNGTWNVLKSAWNFVSKHGKEVADIIGEGSKALGYDEFSKSAKEWGESAEAITKIGNTGLKVAQKAMSKFDFSSDRSGMTEQDVLMAKMAKIAYHQKDNRPTDYLGYTYSPEDSSRDMAVYKKGNEIVLGIRGTEFDYTKGEGKTVSDVIQDLHITIGNPEKSIQTKRIIAETRKVFDKYPDNHFYTAGHSKGGTESMIIADNFKDDPRLVESFSFNPGATPGMDLKKYAENPKMRFVVKGGDLVSNTLMKEMIDTDVNVLVLSNGISLNPMANHGIANFIDEDWLEQNQEKGQEHLEEEKMEHRDAVEKHPHQDKETFDEFYGGGLRFHDVKENIGILPTMRFISQFKNPHTMRLSHQRVIDNQW